MTDTKRHASMRRDEGAVSVRPTPIEDTAAGPLLQPVGGVDPVERSHRIEEAAYYRAQQRGFCPGCELEDWLDAEREIDDQLRIECGEGGGAKGQGCG